MPLSGKSSTRTFRQHIVVLSRKNFGRLNFFSRMSTRFINQIAAGALSARFVNELPCELRFVSSALEDLSRRCRRFAALSFSQPISSARKNLFQIREGTYPVRSVLLMRPTEKDVGYMRELKNSSRSMYRETKTRMRNLSVTRTFLQTYRRRTSPK